MLKNLPDWAWIVIVILLGGLFYFVVRDNKPLPPQDTIVRDSITLVLKQNDSLLKSNKVLDSIVKRKEAVVAVKDSTIKVISTQKKISDNKLVVLDKQLKEVLASVDINIDSLKDIALQQSAEIVVYQELFSEYEETVQAKDKEIDSIIVFKDSTIADLNGGLLTTTSLLGSAKDEITKKDIIIEGLDSKNRTNKTFTRILAGAVIILAGIVLGK